MDLAFSICHGGFERRRVHLRSSALKIAATRRAGTLSQSREGRKGASPVNSWRLSLCLSVLGQFWRDLRGGVVEKLLFWPEVG